jgi:hypothetical protein
MVKKSIENVLSEELANADSTELDQNLALALRYYDAETGDVAAGMSDLVSPDVRDAIESSMAEIMGAMTTDEPLAVFDPKSPDDVAMAEFETIAVHRQIMGRNRGSVIIETAVRDAMLQRFGIIKVDGDDEGIFLDVVAPENFKWSNDLASPWLNEARFFAERKYYTRAQLVQEEVSRAKAYEAPTGQPTDEASLVRHLDDFMMATAAREEDEQIECWECYLRNNDKGGYDCYLFVDPSLVLEREWYEFHPYATGVVTIRPHRFDGVSVFDKLQQIQTAKTYMLRQLATQTKLASQSRLAIRDRGVNPEDLQSDALNPVIRCKGSPGEELLPLPIQDVTSQLLSTLQWLDGIRREDGGASIDMTSPQMQVANESAHAAERRFSVKELQTQLMLKTIGETLIRSLYLLVHATMKQKMGFTTIKSGSEYYQGDPSQFPQRTDVQVDMGATLGVRQRRLGALATIIQQQNMVLTTGGSGILVTPQNLYAAQIAFGKLSGINQSELFWTDPSSPEAQQAAQMQAQAQQAQQQAAMQVQEESIQAAMAIEKYKGENALVKQHMVGEQNREIERLKAEVDYFKAILDAKSTNKELDIQEAQLILSAAQNKTETADEASSATR